MSDETRRMSREERLKAALRDNLKRRKQQTRGRAQNTDDRAEPERDAPLDPNQPSNAERDRE